MSERPKSRGTLLPREEATTEIPNNGASTPSPIQDLARRVAARPRWLQTDEERQLIDKAKEEYRGHVIQVAGAKLVAAGQVEINEANLEAARRRAEILARHNQHIGQLTRQNQMKQNENLVALIRSESEMQAELLRKQVSAEDRHLLETFIKETYKSEILSIAKLNGVEVEKNS
jgi:hypothetical protein